MITKQGCCNWWKAAWVFALVACASVGGLLASRFLVDEPVGYTDDEDHFKYGSFGGEREAGFPFWIWKALPRVCGQHAGRAALSAAGIYGPRIYL